MDGSRPAAAVAIALTIARPLPSGVTADAGGNRRPPGPASP